VTGVNEACVAFAGRSERCFNC